MYMYVSCIIIQVSRSFGKPLRHGYGYMEVTLPRCLWM